MVKLPLFYQLELETNGDCNRFCETCIRNSHPDKAAIASWFEHKLLPTEDIIRIFNEVKLMGFTGDVCLQHYNEPLMDSRICLIGSLAKNYGFTPFICTNADFLTEKIAKELDEVFDQLQIALYMPEPLKAEREKLITPWFVKAKLYFTGGTHIPTHYSPSYKVDELARQYGSRKCSEPLKRLIINHRGQMLMCCDDVIGNFELGDIYTSSVSELWYSDRHTKLVKALLKDGGRTCHSYCMSCPRP